MPPDQIIQEMSIDEHENDGENLLAEDIAFNRNQGLLKGRDSSMSGNCNLDLTQGASIIGKTSSNILSDPY